MEDSKKGGLVRVLQALVPIVGVAIAVVSLLVSLAARRKELTCTLISSTRLVSENLGGIHPDLHVEFGGQPVVSLSKLIFTLRNTGAAAIKGADVIEPVRLQFPASTRILSAAVDRTSPQPFGFTATTAPGGNNVELTFSLLNSGDEAEFSIYVLNSEVQKPSFLGRIVDVTQMSFVNSALNSTSGVLSHARGRATRSIIRWSLSLFLWALSGLLTGLWIAALTGYVKYLPWKWRFKSRYDEIAEGLAKKHEESLKSKDEQVVNEAPEMAAPKQHEQELLMLAARDRQMQHLMWQETKELQESLKESGVPPHPNPFIETFLGLMGFAVFLLGLAFVSGLTGVIIYEALRT